MVAEGAACGAGWAGLGVIAIGVVAFALFSVFGGEDSKQSEKALAGPAMKE